MPWTLFQAAGKQFLSGGLLKKAMISSRSTSCPRRHTVRKSPFGMMAGKIQSRDIEEEDVHRTSKMPGDGFLAHGQLGDVCPGRVGWPGPQPQLLIELPASRVDAARPDQEVIGIGRVLQTHLGPAVVPTDVAA